MQLLLAELINMCCGQEGCQLPVLPLGMHQRRRVQLGLPAGMQVPQCRTWEGCLT